AVHIAVVRETRRDLVWLAPVIVAVLIWYVVLGRTGAQTNPRPRQMTLLRMPASVAWGIGIAAAGLIGLGGWWGPPALVVGAAILALTWWRRPPPAFPLAVLAR